MAHRRDRLLWSGDWWALGAWIVAALAGTIASLQARATDEQVLLVVILVMFAVIGAGWVLGRIISRPLLESAPRATGMGAVGAGAVFLTAWVALVISVMYVFRLSWELTRPVPALVLFASGGQQASVISRAVEVRTTRGSTQTPPTA